MSWAETMLPPSLKQSAGSTRSPPHPARRTHVHAAWAEIRIGRRVQQRRIHRAVLREVVDDQIDELDLVRGERFPAEKDCECFLRRARSSPTSDRTNNPSPSFDAAARWTSSGVPTPLSTRIRSSSSMSVDVRGRFVGPYGRHVVFVLRRN